MYLEDWLTAVYLAVFSLELLILNPSSLVGSSTYPSTKAEYS